MKTNLNDKLIAYLTLLSGIAISIVAEYYSILGLTAIFSAAAIPVIIMGIALGVGKIVATVWLKQNWTIAPWSVRVYLLSAIAVLMLITSMGIFGFLSKAHSDQSLVSGDVLARISIYDEKIKIEKENIEANRKALKQMDEAVDQVMGRSSSETGADKAVAIRRSQQKERARLQQDIAQSQQTITAINEQRAPIAAEVRKVEAEVGPIKYIASFVYGETNEGLLEKAVTWVIIIIIVVFDPLALILLLASQISFQKFRQEEEGDSPTGPVVDVVSPEPTVTPEPEEDFSYVDKFADKLVGTYKIGKVPPSKQLWQDYDPDIAVEKVPSPQEEPVAVSTTTVVTAAISNVATPEEEEAWATIESSTINIEVPKKDDDRSFIQKAYDAVAAKKELEELNNSSSYVQNEEQSESSVWSQVAGSIDKNDYINQSQLKLENHIDEIADLVKNNEIKIEEVPRYIQHEVRAKL
jgi:hypothetical protein